MSIIIGKQKDIPLKPKNVETIAKWLTEKWPKERQNCEVCGKDQWQVAVDP